MLSFRMRSWLRIQANRLGFDVLRHPSPRLLAGHTKLLLNELQIDCVLDVGANEGQYGRMLRSIGYGGNIVSFEPVASSFIKLHDAAADDAKWTIIQAALGREDGTANINVSAGSDFSSFLQPLPTDVDAPLGSSLSVVRVESVTTRRLDSIWSELQGSDRWARVFIKLDTQGYDLEVLGGGIESIEEVMAIQSEISVIPLYDRMPTWLESMIYFNDLGFSPTGIFPVTYHGQLRPIEFDCVLVRPNS